MGQRRLRLSGDQIIRLIESNPYASLCLLTALLLLPNLASMPVSIMEARNFVTAREMVIDGNWLLTTLNGVPRYEKPPLPTWITALSGLIFGLRSLVALRLPAIIMVMFLGCYTYKLADKLLQDKRQSLLAGLILITSFYTTGIVFEAPVDVFTHGFMMAGIYHLYVLLKTEKGKWKNALFSGLFIGCSFLSKGPVSFYVLFIPFLTVYGMIFRFSGFKPKTLPIVLLLFIALISGFSWYYYVHLSDPGTFSAISSKETGNWSSYNVKPFYYYWSFFTQSGLWTIPSFVGLLYPYLKKRVDALSTYRFTLIWTLSSVILLSIIPEKKSRYLMPVLIPMAINTSFYLMYLFQNFSKLTKKAEKWPVYGNFGLIGVTAILLPIGLFVLLKNEALNHWLLMSLTAILLCFSGFLILKSLKQKTLTSTFYGTLFFYAVVYATMLPFQSMISKNAEVSIPEELNKMAHEKQLVVYGNRPLSPELIWYYGEKIPSIQTNQIAPITKQFGLFTDATFKDTLLQANTPFRICYERSFNLNPGTLNGRRHSGRLEGTFYILETVEKQKVLPLHDKE